ncbi:MAG: YybH family protein [Bacteroidia bacterium]
MKQIAAVIFIVFASLGLNAQSKNKKSINEILSVLKLQEQKWNEGDIEGFMEPYLKNDSLMFIGKKGITKGWQQTLNNYKKSYPDAASMGKLQFEIIKIELIHKSSAYVVGKWHLNRDETKGNLSGYFSLLMKKMNNSWQIVIDHSS